LLQAAIRPLLGVRETVCARRRARDGGLGDRWPHAQAPGNGAGQ
jgi:hypothetical protein